MSYKSKFKELVSAYSDAINSGDAGAAYAARETAVNYASGRISQKRFDDNITKGLDLTYKEKFGQSATVKPYNTEKGEAEIERDDAKVAYEGASESQGGGTFLTAGAAKTGNTMLTQGGNKKRALGK